MLSIERQETKDLLTSNTDFQQARFRFISSDKGIQKMSRVGRRNVNPFDDSTILGLVGHVHHGLHCKAKGRCT